MARTERYAIEEVINAIRKGHTALGAAHILGCTPKAVRNYAKKFPKVADALRQERISLRDLGEMSLRGAIARGEGWAVMGIFKTIDEDGNFIPPNRQEITGADGKPLNAPQPVVNVYLPDNGRDDRD